jgi:hypothetical protein
VAVSHHDVTPTTRNVEHHIHGRNFGSFTSCTSRNTPQLDSIFKIPPGKVELPLVSRSPARCSCEQGPCASEPDEVTR